jgi:predicted HicB family RNase H-like nuclease
LKQPKKAKVGRPKLPKGEAKGRTVQVRLTADDLKAVTLAAKASKQVLSDWIRGTLRTAANA